MPSTLSMTIFSGQGAAMLIAVSTSMAMNTIVSQLVVRAYQAQHELRIVLACSSACWSSGAAASAALVLAVDCCSTER